LIEWNDSAILKKKDGAGIKVIMIVLELAEGGELFDVVSATGKFDD
jgi:hypothetical protein